MKRIGTINGIPIYEDPDAPPLTLYFLNDKCMEISPINTTNSIKLFRWYRKLRRYIKLMLNKISNKV